MAPPARSGLLQTYSEIRTKVLLGFGNWCCWLGQRHAGGKRLVAGEGGWVRERKSKNISVLRWLARRSLDDAVKPDFLLRRPMVHSSAALTHVHCITSLLLYSIRGPAAASRSFFKGHVNHLAATLRMTFIHSDTDSSAERVFRAAHHSPSRSASRKASCNSALWRRPAAKPSGVPGWRYWDKEPSTRRPGRQTCQHLLL